MAVACRILDSSEIVKRIEYCAVLKLGTFA
jgi:hypothetical protein